VGRSRELGARILDRLRGELADVAAVGDVRGLGMLLGIELVRDRESKEPFLRTERVAEGVLASAREAGLMLYSSTGQADGTNGDLIVLGPPFVLSDDEAELLVAGTADAIRSAT
jgi:adenosylmethionine-8-amino-7-oxononanoate aminotransferase